MDQVSGRVECYSGSRYAERPTAVWWEGQRLAVESVLQEWRDPRGQGFRVLAGGNRFELIYNEHDQTWSILPL